MKVSGVANPALEDVEGVFIVIIAVSSQVGLSVSKVERQRHDTRIASK